MLSLRDDMNSVDQQVGQRVRLHRKAKGLSRGQLADRLKIQSRVLRTFEMGTQRMGPKMLRDICIQLDVAPGDIFQPLESRTTPSRHRSVSPRRSAS